MNQWLVWHGSQHLKEPGMIMVSQGEPLTVTRCPPPCCAGVALTQGRLMAQRHEHIPSLPLREGRTTHLSHYAVPVRCTAPCILGGWQRGSSRHSVLSSTLAKLLHCPCMLRSRSPPEEHLMYEGYVQPADDSQMSACTWTTSGNLLSAKLDPKPVEGSAIATDQVFPADMWRYSPKTYVFKWEMPFFSWPTLMGLQDELASLSCSIKVFPVQRDMWSFPYLEAVPDTTGIKPLQFQRVQLNSDVNNTLSSA